MRSMPTSGAPSQVAPSYGSRRADALTMNATVLVEGTARSGIALNEAQAAKLIRLLDELDDWNQRMNLTAIRERSQQITKHLLDSLSIQPFLRGTRVCDVGTGAGFPGIPLAIVNGE